MNEEKILEKIFDLPEPLKLEALHYIEYLIIKSQQDKKNQVKKPKFGSAAGKYEISSDFDEPLEDFKEYMY